MTTPDLAAIAARCAAATERPYCSNADLIFEYHARTDIPSLLEYISKLEQVVEAAKVACDLIRLGDSFYADEVLTLALSTLEK